MHSSALNEDVHSIHYSPAYGSLKDQPILTNGHWLVSCINKALLKKACKISNQPDDRNWSYTQNTGTLSVRSEVVLEKDLPDFTQIFPKHITLGDPLPSKDYTELCYENAFRFWIGLYDTNEVEALCFKICEKEYWIGSLYYEAALKAGFTVWVSDDPNTPTILVKEGKVVGLLMPRCAP